MDKVEGHGNHGDPEQQVDGAEDDPKTKDNSNAIPNSTQMELRTILRKWTKRSQTEARAQEDPKEKDNRKAIPNSR